MNPRASSSSAATNTLFVSGSANELIGTDERWGELWITNWTSGAGSIPSVNGNSFFAELPALAGQTNALHVAIPDRAGNMGYATTDVYAPSAGAAPSTSSYSYNEAGCLTNLNGVSLDWDERYRLTRVDDASSFVAYEYDVLNRRTSRSFVATSPSLTNVEHYAYNGNQVAADLDGSGNLLRTYVWGTGIDNLLSFTDHTTSNSYYAIKDHQNSVIALTDDTGSVVESYEYDAWGNTCVFDASGTELTQSAYSNRYTFQGREIDWDTGLYYFRARWYDPETGRWLSKDPIGISGGLNLYAFVGNNPVNFMDPSGLMGDRRALARAAKKSAAPGPGAGDIAKAGEAAIITGAVIIPVAKIKDIQNEMMDLLMDGKGDSERFSELEKEMNRIQDDVLHHTTKAAQKRTE